MPPAQAQPQGARGGDPGAGPRSAAARRRTAPRASTPSTSSRTGATAEEAFVAALALDPNDAICDATYGMFLATAYRHDEARVRLTRALDRDPFSAPGALPGGLGGLRDVRRRGGARHTARAVELQPDALGTALAADRGAADDRAPRRGDRTGRADAWRGPGAPVFVGVQAMVLGRAGRLDEARRLGEELYERAGRGEYVSPVEPAGAGPRPGRRRARASAASPPAPTAARRRSRSWRPTRWLLDPIPPAIRRWTAARFGCSTAPGRRCRAALQSWRSPPEYVEAELQLCRRAALKSCPTSRWHVSRGTGGRPDCRSRVPPGSRGRRGSARTPACPRAALRSRRAPVRDRRRDCGSGTC